MKINIIVLMSAIMLLSGCVAHRTLVMQANGLSMTKTHAENSAKLKKVGDVEEQFCAGDEPKLRHNQNGDIGLVDEAIYKAQGEGKRGDFIVGAMVYQVNRCIEITGQLVKEP